MNDAKYAASRFPSGEICPVCLICSEYNMSFLTHIVPFHSNIDVDSTGSIATFTAGGSNGSSGFSTSPRTAPHCRPTLEERSTKQWRIRSRGC